MSTRPKLNREWHLANRMPKNPTPAQRVDWHIAHSRHCACREMSESIRRLVDAELAKRKISAGSTLRS